MRDIDRAELVLRDATGMHMGFLSIQVPPRSRNSSPISELTEDEATNGLERIQLMEGGDYRYLLILTNRSAVTVEPREVIFPDDESGMTGRLRPGLYVGRLALRIFQNGLQLAETAIEVRSRKLDYLSQYRWMLDDIAEIATDLALQRFSAVEQRLALDADLDVTTLYQRFCFLKSAILGARLSHAFAIVAAQPHVDWGHSTDEVSPSRGVRGSSLVARALAKSTARTSWSSGWHPVIDTLPVRLPVSRFDSHRDNIPNRFVRFVFEEWRALIDDFKARLEIERLRYVSKCRSVPTPIVRGLSEIAEVAERLDLFLRSKVFHGVGRLTQFPGSNQVLQRREGYRDIRELYALSEFAGLITWDGGEDVFGAGQRNVANLYEYWVFLQLARIINEVTEGGIRLDGLLKKSLDGITLGLKQEKASILKGFIKRHGTLMRIELSFNRSFAPTASGGSWTRTMRPDCSILITPTIDDPLIEPVSLHFDAKYRVESVDDILGQPGLDANADDLVKMHAYRDAILQAVGAYVIYPGDKNQIPFQKFTEIVPGLGAFSLTPGSNGPNGYRELKTFISEIIDHLALRGTRRARATFWQNVSYRSTASMQPDGSPWLKRPPADTVVLFGYVKSDEHLKWIRANRLYNLRADDRQGSVPLDSQLLRAEVLMIYGPSLGTSVETFVIGDAPRIMSNTELLAHGYPGPGGRVYFCLAIESVPTPARVDATVVTSIARYRSTEILGAPFCATYLAVLEHLKPR